MKSILRNMLLFNLILTCFLFGQTADSSNLIQAQAHPEYVPGEVLVKLKSGAGIQAMDSHLQSIGVQTVQRYDALNILKCTYAAGQDVRQVISRLDSSGNYEYCEPNYIYHILNSPNDPDYSDQWALHNTGQTGGTNDADIDAPEAWNIQTGSRDVIVGVIDTGIDYNHPDLQANIWTNPGESGSGKETNGIDDDGNGFVDDFRGWDFVNNDNDPFDDNAHGTHVAGIIGATGNNNRGISGASWEVSLVGLKFLAGNGSGSTSDAIEAIQYAVQMNIPILNNSWGGGGFSQALADAIEAADQAGILFLAAAGNESNNNDSRANYPSNYTSENVLAVASSTDRDGLSSFSNYGATTVDLAAPGSDILSTTPGNRYQEFSGTSMATPYVAGVAALLMAQYPGIDHVSLKYRLMGSVDPKSAFSSNTVTGGRLNANNALSTSPLVTTVRQEDTDNTQSPYPITAYVVDDGNITGATLEYSLSGGGSGSVAMTANGTEYSASIPAQATGTVITYFVKATDNDNNTAQGQSLSFEIGGDGGGGGGGCAGAPLFTINTGNINFDGLATVLFNMSVFLLLMFFFLKQKRKFRLES